MLPNMCEWEAFGKQDKNRSVAKNAITSRQRRRAGGTQILAPSLSCSIPSAAAPECPARFVGRPLARFRRWRAVAGAAGANRHPRASAGVDRGGGGARTAPRPVGRSLDGLRVSASASPSSMKIRTTDFAVIFPHGDCTAAAAAFRLATAWPPDLFQPRAAEAPRPRRTGRARLFGPRAFHGSIARL
jgi:hypothetical protein